MRVVVPNVTFVTMNGWSQAKLAPMSAAELQANAKSLVWLTFGLGAILSLIQELSHPEGWLWMTVRVAVGVVFVLALAAWLASVRRDRVRPE
jgi:hypothetical protein